MLRPSIAVCLALCSLLVAQPARGADGDEAPPASKHKEKRARLEGGVGFAATGEMWTHSRASAGARFDVAVGVGGPWSFVIGESGRFALDPHYPGMMAFDLQCGVAYGAPYQTRTGLGLVLLVGGERLATSTTFVAHVAWGAVASLGARASVDVGPIDLWLGVDGLFRSANVETGLPRPASFPPLSAVVSIGGFLPAFIERPMQR